VATHAPDTLKWLADEWEDAIASAVCSGIVGDSAHQGSASKHLSRQDQPSGSWCDDHAKDKKGPSNMAAAIDMSMNDADMIAVTNRLITVFNNRSSHPAAAYIGAFNGWTGSGSARRWNLVSGKVSDTDSSHKWHVHLSTFYQYVGTDQASWDATAVILGAVTGDETLGEDDVRKEDFFAWSKELITSDQAYRDQFEALAVTYTPALDSGVSVLNMMREVHAYTEAILSDMQGPEAVTAAQQRVRELQDRIGPFLERLEREQEQPA
jgi:hypothetical protein